MGRRSRPEEKEEEPAEDSEDEIVWRLHRMACLESHHYACDHCGQVKTGSHNFNRVWEGDPPKRSWLCTGCTQVWNQRCNPGQRVPLTPPWSTSSPAACASDNAAASSLTPAEWLNGGVDTPVPQDNDLEDKGVWIEPQDNDDKDEKPQDNDDKDEKPQDNKDEKP